MIYKRVIGVYNIRILKNINSHHNKLIFNNTNYKRIYDKKKSNCKQLLYNIINYYIYILYKQ